MKIKCDHVNLTVTNIDESILWYNKIFDFELVESGKDVNRWAIIANNDFMICMTEYLNRSAFDLNDQTKFHQIYHFGIRVPDERDWLNRIQENNLQLNYGGEIKYPFSKSWYVSDPDGFEIEVSYTKDPILKFK